MAKFSGFGFELDTSLKTIEELQFLEKETDELHSFLRHQIIDVKKHKCSCASTNFIAFGIEINTMSMELEELEALQKKVNELHAIIRHEILIRKKSSQIYSS